MRSMKNDELFARISFELTISVSPMAVVIMIEPTMMEGSFILLSKVDIVPSNGAIPKLKKNISYPILT
jgi:hypothetical protein